MSSQILNIRDDDSCINQSSYDGYLGLRIASVFVIMFSSGLGIYLPMSLRIRFSNHRFLTNKTGLAFMTTFYFICKNFGQGVIFATSFIHLLQPANEELSDPCLSDKFQVYPYAFAICMLSSFSIYLLEIVSRHYIEQYVTKSDIMSHHGHGLFKMGEYLEGGHSKEDDSVEGKDVQGKNDVEVGALELGLNKNSDELSSQSSTDVVEGDKHISNELDTLHKVLSVCILEFGIIFHSVFVGLTLGVVSRDEFKVLFVVLVFHQMFEGLGCGARVSEVRLPNTVKLLYGGVYTLTTPVSIAIGLGVKSSLSMDTNGMNLVSGVFDSISAGILMYNGYSLLFSAFNDYPGRIRMKLLAYITTCFGVGIMALLGRWA